MLRNKISSILFLLLLAQLFQIIYFQRAIIFQKYNVAYWKDRYEHSQYQLPISQRAIGDSGLYAYAGYRLIQGDDPFSINVDKPPLGKYLIGLSIYLFGTPMIYAIVFSFGSLLLLYVLAKQLTHNTTLSLFITLMTSFDAFIFTQMYDSLLDISQLFFMFAYLVTIFHYHSVRLTSSWYLLMSGMLLGLYCEIKPPILLPILILPLIHIARKNILHTFTWLFGLGIGIVIPYIHYLQLGHSILDIARVHKFMYTFYRATQTPLRYGAIVETLILGRFKNLGTNVFTHVSEWSIIWPISLFLAFMAGYYIFYIKKQYNDIFTTLIVLSFGSLLLYCFIPAYPRYLISVLPLLYCIGIWYLSHVVPKKIQTVGAIICICFGLFSTYRYMQAKPDGLLQTFYYSYTHQYFQDIYEENILPPSAPQFTRNQFRLINQKALYNGAIDHINITENSRTIRPENDAGSVDITITYHSRYLGEFSQQKTLRLVRNANQWKIQWNWNLLFEGFTPEYTIVQHIKPGTRGRVYSASKKLLVSDAPSFLVSITPSKLHPKDETEIVQHLSRISGISSMALHNAYTENPLPQTSIGLFTFYTSNIQKDIDSLKAFDALSITPHISRIYDGSIGKSDIGNTIYPACCTNIYTSVNYHGISGPDMAYETQLAGYDGGSIEMLDTNNQIVRVLHTKDAMWGKDVVLPQ